MAFDRGRSDTKMMLASQNLDIESYLVKDARNTIIFPSYKDIAKLGVLKGDYLVIDRGQPVEKGDWALVSHEGRYYIMRIDGRKCKLVGKIIGRFRTYNSI